MSLEAVRAVVERYSSYTQPSGDALLRDLREALDPTDAAGHIRTHDEERTRLDLDAYYAAEQDNPEDIYRDFGGEA